MADNYRRDADGHDAKGGAGRTLIIILVLLALAAIAAVATGFVDLSAKGGKLPDVEVKGGDMPEVGADVGSIDVGTKNTTVELPKVEVGRPRRRSRFRRSA
jgi:flagellar basal body-associated protein FliL